MRTYFTILAFFAVACSGEQNGERGPADIRVGFFGALTGPTATFGVQSREGAQFAVDEVNARGGIDGRKVRLFVEDDRGMPEEAAAVVSKLITSNNVVGLVGENASSRSLAAAPIAQSNRVPMISPSSTNPEVTKKGEYIFRACYIDSHAGKAIAKLLREQQIDRAAILKDVKNDYSIGLADFFEEAFTAAGGRVVIEQSYAEGDVDFRSQLTAIRSAAPQAIFVPGYYTEAGQIAVQARDLGITVPLVGGDGWDSPTLLEIGGRALDGCLFASERARDDAFRTRFRKKFGREPAALNALAYDAMSMLLVAIDRADSTEGEKIQKQLASLRDFPGASGKITVGPDRNPIKPVAILEVRNGEAVMKGWIEP